MFLAYPRGHTLSRPCFNYSELFAGAALYIGDRTCKSPTHAYESLASIYIEIWLQGQYWEISKLSFHAPCYRRGMFSLFSLVVRDIFLNLLQISLFELPFPMDYHECQHKMTIYFWIPYRSNIETLWDPCEVHVCLKGSQIKIGRANKPRHMQTLWHWIGQRDNCVFSAIWDFDRFRTSLRFQV